MKNLHLSWNSKVHYLDHKRQPLHHAIIQMYRIHVDPEIKLDNDVMLISTPRYAMFCLPFMFTHKNAVFICRLHRRDVTHMLSSFSHLPNNMMQECRQWIHLTYRSLTQHMLSLCQHAVSVDIIVTVYSHFQLTYPMAPSFHKHLQLSYLRFLLRKQVPTLLRNLLPLECWVLPRCFLFTKRQCANPSPPNSVCSSASAYKPTLTVRNIRFHLHLCLRRNNAMLAN
jgi:hypothetical protein